MNDDLIKRLRDGVVEHDKRWSGDTHDDLGGSADYEATETIMEDAAAALSEAQATIARQQVMLDRALESNGDMQAQVALLKEALRPFAQEHAWGPHSRFKIVLAGPEGDITGADLDRARAALEAKHG